MFYWIISKDIVIFKKIFDQQKQRYLSFAEIYHQQIDRFVRAQQFTDRKFQPIENTAEEILKATQEMDQRLKGTLGMIQVMISGSKNLALFFSSTHRHIMIITPPLVVIF